MIYEYAVNTEEVIFNKTKEKIDVTIAQKDKSIFNVSSDFYLEVDRLTIIIENTIKKGQTKKAEHYIKYFFSTLYETYKILAEKSLASEEQLTQFTLELQKQLKENRKSQTLPLPDETIIPFNKLISEKAVINRPENYFESKVQHILYNNINNRNYTIFNFIFSLFKILVHELGKQKLTQGHSVHLLRNITLLSNQIFLLEESLNTYEKLWYRKEINNWFVELVTDYSTDLEKLNNVTGAMFNVLRTYIDKGRDDIFESFIEVVSTRINFIGSRFENFEDAFCEKNNILLYELHAEIRRNKIYDGGFISTSEFIDSNKTAKSILTSYLLQKGVSSESINRYIEKYLTNQLDKYKVQSTRKLLVQACVYSLIRKEYNFFFVYRTYHQPEDSDAIWVGDSFSIRNINDIKFLLLHEEEIGNPQLRFSIGHHGFTKYLRKFIICYIIHFYRKSKNNSISIPAYNYSESAAIVYQLKEIERNIHLSDLIKILPNLTEKEYKSILEKIIENAERQSQKHDLREVSSAQLDEELVSEFKSKFSSQFTKSATLRKILHEAQLIEQTPIQSEENELGINQLINKKLFIRQNQIGFFRFPEDMAREVARAESNIIYSVIAENSNQKSMHWNDFLKFIKSHNQYNMIIGHTTAFSELEKEYKFQPYYAAGESLYSGTEGFMGVLENKYDVFNITSQPNSEFILLNTTNVGKMQQYEAPIMEHSQTNGNFGFSIIDFNIDNNALQQHLNNNHKEQDLRKHVWLRIFESFKFKIGNAYNGLLITIIDDTERQ